MSSAYFDTNERKKVNLAVIGGAKRCPSCISLYRPGVLSIEKQIDDVTYMTCNYQPACDYKEKVELHAHNQQPDLIEFSDPLDTGAPGAGAQTKLICEPLKRGQEGGLRSRLDRLNRKGRKDADIYLGSSGYIVSDSTSVYTEHGWSRVE